MAGVPLFHRRRLPAAGEWPVPEVPVGPWIRRSRRTAYENPWLTIYHDDVVRPDGEAGIYGVVHLANVAVGVVAIDARDRVALVGQWRYTLDSHSWEIPEGGVPRNESPLDGARRELREETGLSANTWREIGVVHLSNSVSDEVAHLYLATGLAEGAADPDGTEDLTFRWEPFDEAVAMTMDGRITDALSVLALQRVALDRASQGARRRRAAGDPEVAPRRAPAEIDQFGAGAEEK
jgi:8-oxo-dGTP pyrophosphatase MutT (NUDIX family)